MWWSNNEHRKRQKEEIKNAIKRTKLNEKTAAQQVQHAGTPPGMSYSVPSVPTSDTFSDALGRATRAASEDSQYSLGYDFNQPLQDAYAPYMHPAQGVPYAEGYSGYPVGFPPFEVDIKTERQMFVNDIPTRRDSSISTFSTFQPPPPHAMLPSYTGDEWVHEDFAGETKEPWGAEEAFDLNFFDFSHGTPHGSPRAVIQVDDSDQRLLDHFINNVLRLIFPILEVNQHGSVKQEVILPALESNPCYLHCCLSISAIHLKATRRLPSEEIDGDIMRHRFKAVAELCEALNHDADHMKILEATLGMIFFQCSVGRPDDSLPDIPWHQHFQAAKDLVNKLELPGVLEDMSRTGVHPPFNMTLTAWIDILGSTMLGLAPQYASTYRNKHLAGSTSGLCELMGCEDRVMYLLSEIACLDALKLEGRVDDLMVCGHITALAKQLDATETHEPLSFPVGPSGAIRPRQLSRNMTAVFRIAARVYLCSLVPDYNRYQPSTINLIARLAETLQFIPSGLDGYDRCLVWPLLICGSFSIPSSPFRRVFAERCDRLGEQAEYGSFGRMVRLLTEVWRRADEITLPSSETCTPTPISAGLNGGESPSMKKQDVHWRDVMQQNEWHFLLI
ncbi:putative c6 sexual development transcription factor [Phaeomoniella chlamydospora]|uniref:Putative c6 sexual development transcription factor n=1 Tax=Phaeomoniella chlamydospora TaxID=158046 RepID=A0A0G2F4B7_PHACM|nr:putative c6 sexual development transcription factor [Phaeomoniella chlamydospora]